MHSRDPYRASNSVNIKITHEYFQYTLKDDVLASGVAVRFFYYLYTSYKVFSYIIMNYLKDKSLFKYMRTLTI